MNDLHVVVRVVPEVVALRVAGLLSWELPL
jgi:hypothetical protein